MRRLEGPRPPQPIDDIRPQTLDDLAYIAEKTPTSLYDISVRAGPILERALKQLRARDPSLLEGTGAYKAAIIASVVAHLNPAESERQRRNGHAAKEALTKKRIAEACTAASELVREQQQSARPRLLLTHHKARDSRAQELVAVPSTRRARGKHPEPGVGVLHMAGPSSVQESKGTLSLGDSARAGERNWRAFVHTELYGELKRHFPDRQSWDAFCRDFEIAVASFPVLKGQFAEKKRQMEEARHKREKKSKSEASIMQEQMRIFTKDSKESEFPYDETILERFFPINDIEPTAAANAPISDAPPAAPDTSPLSDDPAVQPAAADDAGGIGADTLAGGTGSDAMVSGVTGDAGDVGASGGAPGATDAIPAAGAAATAGTRDAVPPAADPVLPAAADPNVVPAPRIDPIPAPAADAVPHVEPAIDAAAAARRAHLEAQIAYYRGILAEVQAREGHAAAHAGDAPHGADAHGPDAGHDHPPGGGEHPPHGDGHDAGHGGGGHHGDHGAHGHGHDHGHGHHAPPHFPRNLSEWGSLFAAVGIGSWNVLKFMWKYVVHPTVHAAGYVASGDPKHPWQSFWKNISGEFKKAFKMKGGGGGGGHGGGGHADHSHGGGGGGHH